MKSDNVYIKSMLDEARKNNGEYHLPSRTVGVLKYKDGKVVTEKFYRFKFSTTDKKIDYVSLGYSEKDEYGFSLEEWTTVDPKKIFSVKFIKF